MARPATQRVRPLTLGSRTFRDHLSGARANESFERTIRDMQYAEDESFGEWPHDMVLAVYPNEHVLDELLFLRASQGWDVASWLPAADPRPATSKTSRLADGASDLWEEWWRA